MITVQDLTLQQGTFALRGITFQVPTGQYAVLMGRTGCGKTTLLEAVAGLRSPIAGEISLGNAVVTHWSPAARALGYVPQDGALFRTMTVREHLAFALVIRGVPWKEIHTRVLELAEWLGLHAMLDRRPAGLSGGEAQRVALGRALSFRPRYLLLDEPLSSLDDETRAQLIKLLDGLRQRREVTVLHVTHNRFEADQLGDFVLRLDGGKVQSIGTERDGSPE